MPQKIARTIYKRSLKSKEFFILRIHVDKIVLSRLLLKIQFARVVKLADTPDLGSGAARREGSSPSPSTIYNGV